MKKIRHSQRRLGKGDRVTVMNIEKFVGRTGKVMKFKPNMQVEVFVYDVDDKDKTLKTGIVYNIRRDNLRRSV